MDIFNPSKFKLIQTLCNYSGQTTYCYELR